MPYAFTRKGYTELWEIGVEPRLISKHTQEREAVERVLNLVDTKDNCTYEIRNPVIEFKKWMDPIETGTISGTNAIK